MSRLRPLLLVMLVLASCGDGIAARVGDREVTDADLQTEIEEISNNDDYIAHVGSTSGMPATDEDGSFTSGFVAAVLTRAVHVAVVEQVADRLDVEVTRQHRDLGIREAADEVGGRDVLDAFRSSFRSELIDRAALLVALRDRMVRGLTPESYYDGHRPSFAKPCTRHIVVATRDEALEAAGRIDRGERFADVASDVSLDEATGPRGGDLGCNGVGDLVPELDRASLGQSIGEIGPPISTDGGWQLLLVESRDVPPFDRVKGEAAVALSDLAEARTGAALREVFEETVITVSSRYGSWDPSERKVIL